MTDPRRLTAGGDDLGSAELTRWLIDSARSEEPGTDALQRTLLAAGATGAVLAAATATGSATAAGATATSAVSSGAVSSGAVSSATTAAASTAAVAGSSAVGGGAVAAGKAAGLSLLGAAGKGAAVKWLAVSVLGGATLVGGSKLLAPTRSEAPARQHTTEVAEKSAPVIVAQPAVKEPAEPAPAQQQVAIPAEKSVPERAPRVANEPTTTAPTDPEVIEATALHKEVQWIDQAREAKASGQHARVIALTQQYLAGFPRGRLLPEAIFLKMESESALGRTQQASQSAKLLLRVAPKSPQAARARELSEAQTP
jgi:hypothetical protein